MIDPHTLERHSLLRTAPPETRAVLAQQAVEHAYAAGEVIFLAGSEPTGLHLVLAGRVRVVQGRGARQHLVHWENPGGTLGDVPLFAGGVYPATAIAAEPTRCAIISRAAIHAAIAARPDVAFLLLERLALRVRGLVERLDRIALRSATARLAGYLLLADDGPSGKVLLADTTQTQLAEELGTVREIVVRGLKALRRRGAIRPLGRGEYAVLSRAELERAAEE